MLLDYRAQGKYLLHEFVAMPNHIHLLISPRETLERSLQLIKGGFSFRIKKELGYAGEVWQSSFYDHRVRDAGEYARFRNYIHENPVRAGPVSAPQEYPYGSASEQWILDEVPQRLKPKFAAAAKLQS